MKKYALPFFFLSCLVNTVAWSQETSTPQSPTSVTDEKSPEQAEEEATPDHREQTEDKVEKKEEDKTEASAQIDTEEDVVHFSSEEELKRWQVAMKHRKQSDYQRVAYLLTSDISEVVVLSAFEAIGLVILAESAVLNSDVDINENITPAFILAPLLGGVVAGISSQKILSTIGQDFRGGSLDLVRGSFFLGAVNSGTAVLVLDNMNLENFTPENEGGPIMAGLGSIATIGTAIGVGLVTPLKNPAAGAVGISGGMTGAALTLLMNAAFDNPLRENIGYGLVAASNVGFAAGVVLSEFVPVRRLDTWMWDIGGLLGGWTALTLATNLNAPNPIIGWGSTSLGVLLGGAGGYALSKWLIQDQNPNIAKVINHINIAPMVVQGLKNEKPASGMQLRFAF